MEYSQNGLVFIKLKAWRRGVAGRGGAWRRGVACTAIPRLSRLLHCRDRVQVWSERARREHTDTYTHTERERTITRKSNVTQNVPIKRCSLSLFVFSLKLYYISAQDHNEQ